MRKTILPLICITILLQGCMSIRVGTSADDYIIKPEKVPPFALNGTLELVNQGQAGEQVFYVVPVNRNKFIADYQQWTDTAIKITDKYVNVQGHKASGNNKVLKLKVENATQVTDKAIQALSTELVVETGNGLRKRFIGRGYGWDSWGKKANGALIHTVEHMLNDAEIKAYLGE